jgi:hypothetical protein
MMEDKKQAIKECIGEKITRAVLFSSFYEKRQKSLENFYFSRLYLRFFPIASQ